MRNPRIRKNFKFRTLEDVEIFVNRLLEITWFYQGNKVRLHEKEYTFKWDKLSKKRLGYCDLTIKEIGLAKKIIELNLKNTEQLRLVVLHEIAHAICYELFADYSHSKTWKEVLLFIGGDGKVRYDPAKMIMPVTKYTLICPHCNAQTPYTRKPTGIKTCGYCCVGRFNLKYKLSVIKNY